MTPRVPLFQGVAALRPYRYNGIIHRQPDEAPKSGSSELPVNNSAGSVLNFSLFDCTPTLPAGFAARPGRRMAPPKRLTFTGRVSPPDGGFGPMTNAQNFSPASGSDEFYKDFAGQAKPAFPNS